MNRRGDAYARLEDAPAPRARVDTLFEESKKVSGANITVRKALSAAQSALDHAAKKRAAKGSAAAHVARTSEGLRRLSALPTAQLLAAPYVADWLVCQLPGLVEQVNDAGSTAAAEAAAKELWSSVCRRAVLYLQASDWNVAADLALLVEAGAHVSFHETCVEVRPAFPDFGDFLPADHDAKLPKYAESAQERVALYVLSQSGPKVEALLAALGAAGTRSCADMGGLIWTALSGKGQLAVVDLLLDLLPRDKLASLHQRWLPNIVTEPADGKGAAEVVLGRHTIGGRAFEATSPLQRSFFACAQRLPGAHAKLGSAYAELVMGAPRVRAARPDLFDSLVAPAVIQLDDSLHAIQRVAHRAGMAPRLREEEGRLMAARLLAMCPTSGLQAITASNASQVQQLQAENAQLRAQLQVQQMALLRAQVAAPAAPAAAPVPASALPAALCGQQLQRPASSATELGAAPAAASAGQGSEQIAASEAGQAGEGEEAAGAAAGSQAAVEEAGAAPAAANAGQSGKENAAAGEAGQAGEGEEAAGAAADSQAAVEEMGAAPAAASAGQGGKEIAAAGEAGQAGDSSVQQQQGGANPGRLLAEAQRAAPAAGAHPLAASAAAAEPAATPPPAAVQQPLPAAAQQLQEPLPAAVQQQPPLAPLPQPPLEALPAAAQQQLQHPEPAPEAAQQPQVALPAAVQQLDDAQIAAAAEDVGLTAIKHSSQGPALRRKWCLVGRAALAYKLAPPQPSSWQDFKQKVRGSQTAFTAYFGARAKDAGLNRSFLSKNHGALVALVERLSELL